MEYEAIIFGMGVIAAILAGIGIGIRDRDDEEDIEKRKKWYYILLDPSMLRLLFVTGSIYFLLLTVAMVNSIAQTEGYTELLSLGQGGYFALLFVMIVFLTLSVLSIFAGIMELFTDVGEVE